MVFMWQSTQYCCISISLCHYICLFLYPPDSIVHRVQYLCPNYPSCSYGRFTHKRKEIVQPIQNRFSALQKRNFPYRREQIFHIIQDRFAHMNIFNMRCKRVHAEHPKENINENAARKREIYSITKEDQNEKAAKMIRGFQQLEIKLARKLFIWTSNHVK